MGDIIYIFINPATKAIVVEDNNCMKGTAYIKSSRDMSDQLLESVEKLVQTNKNYIIDALEFYADKESYRGGSQSMACCEEGSMAREALLCLYMTMGKGGA